MFDLYYLNKDYKWSFYYDTNDIDLIYRNIEVLNLLDQAEMYRIDIDGRVFAFLNNSEYQLDFMRKHYNTNEKCKPRYESDAYDECVAKCKVKKKGGKKK